MPPPVIIDSAAIASVRALNPGDGDEFLREILGIYFEDTPRRIDELDRSLAAGDAPKFARAAHSIKGSSGNLGAVALREVAGKLETRAEKQGLADVADLLASLKEEYARAHAELTKMVSS